MSPRRRQLCAGAVVCLALWAAAPAQAGQVWVVDRDGVQRVDDPLVPAGAAGGLGPEPAAGGHGRLRTAAAGASKNVRGQRAVARALRVAARRRRISPAARRAYGRLYRRARRTRNRLRGQRRNELASVIATVEAMALRRQLVGSRMKPLFLILRRNVAYWPSNPFPASRDQLRFRGSRMLYEYYPGEGIQLQPLVSAKEANAMHGACVKDTGVECDRDGLRKFLAELVGVSARRGGFRAWEYYFDFGGGRPPWISAMATATMAQALARASKLLGEPSLLTPAREALVALDRRAPTGVLTTGFTGGPHYLQYSFAPRLYIFNAFVQTLIGLFDFEAITGDPDARRRFAAAEPELRAELPFSDIGDWSLYSYRGRESDAGYHELLRELLRSICHRRLGVTPYCALARKYADYTTKPAQLELLGPETATKGDPASVRFSLSKLSAVQLTITRAGQVVYHRVVTFRRGNGSFAWTPRAPGLHSLRLAAKELRTGRELRTRTSGEVEVLPPAP